MTVNSNTSQDVVGTNHHNMDQSLQHAHYFHQLPPVAIGQCQTLAHQVSGPNLVAMENPAIMLAKLDEERKKIQATKTYWVVKLKSVKQTW